MLMTERNDERIAEAFANALGAGRVRRGVALDARTTFRTGGAADWYLETAGAAEVVRAIAVCRQQALPLTLLGGGSNVLVGERGVRGLVLRIWRGAVRVARPGVVRADGGVTLNGLIRWMVQRGLAGLERWAGTPGTVGGGLHGNAHFQGELLGAHLVRACLADPQGRVREVAPAELELGYDTSRLQRSGRSGVVGRIRGAGGRAAGPAGDGQRLRSPSANARSHWPCPAPGASSGTPTARATCCRRALRHPRGR